MVRLLARAAAVVCVAALLTGCTPTPSASPTPTAMSRAEAFAAAEATYRAYIDALNKVDLSNPATFEDVYKWETGDALASEKKSLTQMHADGWVVGGKSRITLMSQSATQISSDTHIDIDACVEVASVTLTKPDGTSAVDPDRQAFQSVRTTFVETNVTPTHWQLSHVDGREEGPSCEQ